MAVISARHCGVTRITTAAVPPAPYPRLKTRAHRVHMRDALALALSQTPDYSFRRSNAFARVSDV